MLRRRLRDVLREVRGASCACHTPRDVAPAGGGHTLPRAFASMFRTGSLFSSTLHGNGRDMRLRRGQADRMWLGSARNWPGPRTVTGGGSRVFSDAAKDLVRVSPAAIARLKALQEVSHRDATARADAHAPKRRPQVPPGGRYISQSLLTSEEQPAAR